MGKISRINPNLSKISSKILKKRLNIIEKTSFHDRFAKNICHVTLYFRNSEFDLSYSSETYDSSALKNFSVDDFILEWKILYLIFFNIYFFIKRLTFFHSFFSSSESSAAAVIEDEEDSPSD